MITHRHAMGWAVGCIALLAAWPGAESAAQQKSCIAIDNPTAIRGSVVLSGTNRCGVEIYLNLCAKPINSPEPLHRSYTLKPNQSFDFSYESPAEQAVNAVSTYCAVAPGITPKSCPATCGGRSLSNPQWKQIPTPMQFGAAYPPRAMRLGLGGTAHLRCKVVKDGRVGECTVIRENPQGQGFGDAAMRLARYFRMTTTSADGKSTEGAMVDIPLTFRSN